MTNPREILRRFIKYKILFLILLLTLHNTDKLSTDEMITITCIVTLTYCLLDMISPSIEIKKN